MGLFEYHNRYLALRPSIFKIRNNVPPNISKISKLLLIAFAIVLYLVPTGISESTTPWPYVSINGLADSIIVDERDGTIFVAVEGDIYKFSSELKNLTSTRTATSSKVINETSHNDLMNKILLIVKTSPDLLFSCWQTRDLTLKCWLYKMNDLRFGIPLLWPSESKGFKTEPTDKIRALVNQIDPYDLIIMTSKFTPVIRESNDYQQIPYLPALARFKITKYPKHFSLEKKSVLPYKSRLNEYDILYDYIYSFTHNQHTYFILNDIQKPISTSPIKDIYHKVKLARVCNNDTVLNSYTEISLSCNNQDNINAKFAQFNSTSRGENPNLYVVFETLDGSNSVIEKINERSSLCSYSMILIDDLFHKAISDCHSGIQTSTLLSKLTHQVDPAPLCQENKQDWCSSKVNTFIDGSSSFQYAVKEDSYLSLNGIVSINFFHITQQGPGMKDVLFVGTESGFLTKMSYEEDLLYTIDINKMQIKDHQINEKFKIKTTFNVTDPRKATKYNVDSRNIYAITGKGLLNKFDIDACYYYRTCQACLNTRDPLNCVWCGDTCSHKQDCSSDNQLTLVCPPVIRRFYPRIGPITGRTKLRIEGENFGTQSGDIKVKLDDNDCSVVKETTYSDVIECLTKPVDQPHNASLSVTVLDESTVIYSKGSTIAPNPFTYATVKVFGIHPSLGTKSEKRLVNVFGENLTAGLNRNVLIGGSECKIVESVRPDVIICELQPWNGTVSNGSTTTHYLKVLIDGYEQSVIPKSNFAGYNLSTTYTYSKDTTEYLEPRPLDFENYQENEGSSHIVVSIFVILIGISLIFLFMLLSDRITKFKIKMPLFQRKNDKISDAKVSFRNPQSHIFVNSNPNMATTSINGLVKLNGSVMSSDYFGKPEQVDQDQPLMNNFLDSEMLNLLMQERILIDRNKLTLGHVLGSGQFGRVYKGFLKVDQTGEHMAVAVKTLHSRTSWDDTSDNKAFLEEGLMMKDFEHENVLALIGVTFDSSGLPMVITPFMLYGDLRSYISDEAISPTVKELIDFGTQVAKGMAYLSGLKFVHRDLAARNCMLDDNLIVKVADFGLSRDIYERDYYSSNNKKTKLPVKWMAIESLEKCIYNTKTDVWSYGVLLWELMMRGAVPYPDVDNFDIFSYLKEGRRMFRPDYCPVILYKIMLSCWEENPANRPTFDELVQKVSDVIKQLKIAKDGQQKVSRDLTYCDVLK